MAFEIAYKDLMGRIGTLETPHGTIETPAIMPVINPKQLLIQPRDMRKFGAEILITNSYIIYRTPELRKKAISEGVHRLLDVDLPIMTDSGAYQLSQYGELDVTHADILEFQIKIGTDIAVPLDIPTQPDAPREIAEQEMKKTIERLREAKEAVLRSHSNILLTGPIQGSTFLDLRMKCASSAQEIGFDLYAIGGVVPLMEAYRFSELVDIIMAIKQKLPPSAPIHLFGAGHPMMLGLAVALGCDLFDSAAYALYAKDGRYLTSYGTYKLDDLTYLPCTCEVCSKYTVSELKHLENKVQLIAEHNLHVTFAELKRVKQAIKEQTLWELIAARCRVHPTLLDGFKKALKYVDLIEKFNPAVKRAFFYTGPESANSPEVVRYRHRLLQLKFEGSILITTKKVALEKQFDNIFYLKAPFGPYPVELGETYPIGQAEVVNSFDLEALEAALENVLRFVEANASRNAITFIYDKKWEHGLINKIARFAKTIRFEDINRGDSYV